MMKHRRSLLILSVVLFAGFLLLREGCLSVRDHARLASCRPQLLLFECQEYAKTHEGMFPPLSSEFGRLMFDSHAVQRLGSLSDQLCESDINVPLEIFSDAADGTPVNDWSYVYLGYILENEAQGMAYVRSYHSRAGNERAFEQDLLLEDHTGNCDTNRLFRLREPSVLPPEATCLKSRAASIPVIVEWPENHWKGGKVVYLDGHTEYVKYPGVFPMTPAFIEALRVIDAEIHLSE